MVLDSRVNGRTKLTALIGNPVEHTISPVLHNTLFSLMGINGVYVPLKPAAQSLGDAVRGLLACGFTGFNVTIPFKEAILEHLDDTDREVRLLGTANTVHIKDGRLIGYNTDGAGFIRAFRKQTGEELKGKSVCILGSGGTARTLAVKTAMEGATDICVINRTKSKADNIADYINNTLPSLAHSTSATRAAASDSDEAIDALNRCDVIINTTSAGMFPQTELSPLKEDIEFISKPIVYDVIYNPAETKLLKEARIRGCKTVNGAGMLFYQGLMAFEIWMGITVPDKIIDDFLTEFLNYLVI